MSFPSRSPAGRGTNGEHGKPNAKSFTCKYHLIAAICKVNMNFLGPSPFLPDQLPRGCIVL